MSITTESIAQVQSHLSEDLYFLRKRSPARLYRRTRSPFTARLLDTVALFLATGESNPTLATFWWEQDARLYIAKSSPFSNRNDAIVAQTFFNNLKQAQGFESMIPFLATHGQDSVNKRIRHLRQSLVMGCYLFRKSTDTKDTLDRLKSVLNSEPPFVFDDSENAISTFKELVVSSRRLLEDHARVFSTGHHDKYACRFQRHLDKMAQYLHVEALIKFWKRHGGIIDVSWVPDVESGTAQTMNMGTIMSRHLSVIPGQFASSPEELRDDIVGRCRWMRSTITPHVHAEIKLILHVSENVGLLHLKGNSELLIGSNKTSCFACTCWRKQFNSIFEMNWETTSSYKLIAFETTWGTISSNSLPRSDWAIPCNNNILPLRAIDLGTLRRCHEAVLTGVQDEVKLLLEKELNKSDERIFESKSDLY